LYREKKILLNVDALMGQRRMERGFHLAGQITNISHPHGTGHGHLLIVASVAEACADEHYRTEELPREALATLAKWFPHSGVEADAQLLDVRYIPFAQFAQPPGARAVACEPDTPAQPRRCRGVHRVLVYRGRGG